MAHESPEHKTLAKNIANALRTTAAGAVLWMVAGCTRDEVKNIVQNDDAQGVVDSRQPLVPEKTEQGRNIPSVANLRTMVSLAEEDYRDQCKLSETILSYHKIGIEGEVIPRSNIHDLATNTESCR